MADFATQAGHWYRPDGTPAYTVLSAKGEERPATLRDARKLGLFPSVTTIMRMAAAPGLERWKQNNLLMAALTLPKIEGETLDDYAARCVKDANEQSKAAMQRGTDIHGAVEMAYLGREIGAEYLPHTKATIEAVKAHFGPQEWLAERSFASKLGYGGKLDLHASGIVIDFKTKEFDVDHKTLAWEEQAMQLAAYREGLEMPEARCANVFISTTNPGLVVVHEWPEEELKKGWRMFKALLDFWYAKTGLNNDPA